MTDAPDTTAHTFLEPSTESMSMLVHSFYADVRAHPPRRTG